MKIGELMAWKASVTKLEHAGTAKPPAWEHVASWEPIEQQEGLLGTDNIICGGCGHRRCRFPLVRRTSRSPPSPTD